MVEDIFDIGIRGDAMGTTSIHVRMGVVTERSGSKSSVVLTTERGLRRRGGQRRNIVVLSGHADR